MGQLLNSTRPDSASSLLNDQLGYGISKMVASKPELGRIMGKRRPGLGGIGICVHISEKSNIEYLNSIKLHQAVAYSKCAGLPCSSLPVGLSHSQWLVFVPAASTSTPFT